MPIVSASNGIRPEIRALAVIKLNKPVTPKAINDCVGTGDYAAKYISFLNTRYGFTIESQKDGRKIVAYVCVAEPANVADLRATKPKSKASKAAETKKVVTKAPAIKSKPVAAPKTAVKAATKSVETKKVVTKPAKKLKVEKTPEEIKAANLAKMKAVTAKVTKKAAASKRKIDKLVDEVEQSFGSTGDITGSAVDAGWDSMDGIDVKNFLR